MGGLLYQGGTSDTAALDLNGSYVGVAGGRSCPITAGEFLNSSGNWLFAASANPETPHTFGVCPGRLDLFDRSPESLARE